MRRFVIINVISIIAVFQMLNPCSGDPYFFNEFMKKGYLADDAKDKLENFNKALDIWEYSDGTKLKSKVYIEIGKVYMELKEYNTALEKFTIAAKVFSSNSTAYYLKGKIYGEKKDNKKAISEYKKAIKFDPKMDKSYYEMGLIYKEKEDYETAIDMLGNAIKYNPIEQKYSLARSECYRSTGQIDKMFHDLNRMLQVTEAKIEGSTANIALLDMPDTIKVPVIYYDYMSDGSNPNFQFEDVNGELATMRKGYVRDLKKEEYLGIQGEGQYVIYYKIEPDTVLYAENEIVKGENIKNVIKQARRELGEAVEVRFQVSADKKTLLAIEDPRPGFQTIHANSEEELVRQYLSDIRKPVINLYKWESFNYRVNEWFMPSGIYGTDQKETQFIYDVIQDKWSWSGLVPYDGRSNEFVSKNFKKDDPMKNIVIYDDLIFNLKAAETEEGQVGAYVFDSADFFPINDRGFRDRLEGMEDKANYSFTMEMHNTFKYPGYGYFYFQSDDDLWVFIDGKQHVDFGGIFVSNNEQRIDLKELGLKKGEIYTWDLFYSERMSDDSGLYIESTVLLKEPEPIEVGIKIVYDSFIPGDEDVYIQVQGKLIKHEVWEILIMDSVGNFVNSFKGSGKMKKEYVWDGRNSEGRLVPEDEVFTVMAKGIGPDWSEWESNLDKIRSERKIKIEKGEKLVFHNINFAPYSYDLKDTAKYELRRVYKLLLHYPKLKLLIKGHVATFKWSKEKLIELSEQRALSVKKYLVELGIDESRLESKGFGDTQPFLDADTERARTLNRRTEFEIISNE